MSKHPDANLRRNQKESVILWPWRIISYRQVKLKKEVELCMEGGGGGSSREQEFIYISRLTEDGDLVHLVEVGASIVQMTGMGCGWEQELVDVRVEGRPSENILHSGLYVFTTISKQSNVLNNQHREVHLVLRIIRRFEPITGRHNFTFFFLMKRKWLWVCQKEPMNQELLTR